MVLLVKIWGGGGLMLNWLLGFKEVLYMLVNGQAVKLTLYIAPYCLNGYIVAVKNIIAWDNSQFVTRIDKFCLAFKLDKKE